MGRNVLDLPEDYFKWEKIVLRLCGISFYRQNESNFYKVYSICVLFIVISYMGLEMYDVANVWNDEWEVLLSMLTYITIQIAEITEIFISIFCRKDMINLLNVFQSGTFAANFRRGGKSEFKVIYDHLQFFKAQQKVLFTLIALILIPQITFCYVSRYTMSSKYWMLPVFQTTLPILKTPPYFDVILTYQTIFIGISIVLMATEYTLAVNAVAQLSLQFKILQNCLLFMNERAWNAFKDDVNKKSYASHLYNIFKGVVQYHDDILNLAKSVDYVWGKKSAVIIIGGGVGLCLNLYMISVLPIGTTPFFQAFCVYITLSTKLLMWYYWCNEVTIQSENVAAAVAKIDWVGTDLSFQRGLIQIIKKAQKPTVLRAGNVHDIILEKYVNIIKFSYSGFTLFRSLND